MRFLCPTCMLNLVSRHRPEDEYKKQTDANRCRIPRIEISHTSILPECTRSFNDQDPAPAVRGPKYVVKRRQDACSQPRAGPQTAGFHQDFLSRGDPGVTLVRSVHAWCGRSQAANHITLSLDGNRDGFTVVGQFQFLPKMA